jgi:hypothetical protein
VNRFLRAGLLFVFVAGVAPALLIAQDAPTLPQFSADMKVMTPKAPQGMTGQVFFDKGRTRIDVTVGPQKVSQITDPATQKSIVLMHNMKSYMENSGGGGFGGFKFPEAHQYDPDHPCANQQGTTCKKVGTETINGRVCDKWIFTDAKGQQTTAWVDQKLLFPIKVINSDGTSFELSNIKEGAPDASEFTIPDGYRRFDMGGMMGNRH